MGDLFFLKYFFQARLIDRSLTHASRLNSLSLDLNRAYTHIPPLVRSSPFARAYRDLKGATVPFYD
jgi:hypothetical protein